MISASTWFVVVCLQFVSALLFFVHITANYAYVSELSRHAHDQARYNTTFTITIYVSTLLFMVQVLGLSTLFQLDDLGTARLSQCLTSVTSGTCLWAAWRYFLRDRPPARVLRPGERLWTAGFKQLGRTVRQLWVLEGSE